MTKVDDDCVVHEIDVCLSQNLVDCLYLIQYPLRPPWRAYENTLLREIRFKPMQAVLEMNYAIPEEELKAVREEKTVVYDASNEPIVDASKIATDHTIRSSSVQSKTDYLMGLYRGKELYVASIRGVLQMRPSLRYIDEADEKQRKRKEEEQAKQQAAERTQLGVSVPSSDMDTKSEEMLKPVKVQVRGRETEKGFALQANSHSNLEALEAKEEFQSLELVHRDRIDALVLLEQIVAGGKQKNISFEKMSEQAYLNLIACPPATTTQQQQSSPVNTEQTANSSNRLSSTDSATHFKKTVIQSSNATLSLHAILQLPVDQQISMMMANASVMTFSQLLAYSSCKEETIVLTELQKHAILVQGVWVIKHAPGTNHKHLELTRNWILAQYALLYEDAAKTPYLNRKLIAQTCQQSLSDVKEILSPIAKLTPAMGWRLSEGPDVDFIQSHADLHTKYVTWWRRTLQRIEAELRVTNDNAMHSSQLWESHASSNSTVDSVTSNGYCSDAPAIENQLTQISRVQLHSFFVSAFQKFGVLNISSLSTLLKQALYNIPELQDLNVCDELFSQELPSVAMNISNSWFLKTSGDVATDEYRVQIIALFQQKNNLQRQEIAQSIRASLGRSIPKNIYTKIMKELATVSLRSDTWSLKSGSI